MRFASRPIGAELSAEIAFNDAKTICEFLMTTEAQLADAVGVDDNDD